jgi:hypothetical protein
MDRTRLRSVPLLLKTPTELACDRSQFERQFPFSGAVQPRFSRPAPDQRDANEGWLLSQRIAQIMTTLLGAATEVGTSGNRGPQKTVHNDRRRELTACGTHRD